MTKGQTGPNQRKLYKISIIDPFRVCYTKNDFLYTQNGQTAVPGLVVACYNKNQMFCAGRISDPADPVLVLDWYVEWYHFRNNRGKNKKRHMIPFSTRASFVT